MFKFNEAKSWIALSKLALLQAALFLPCGPRWQSFLALSPECLRLPSLNFQSFLKIIHRQFNHNRDLPWLQLKVKNNKSTDHFPLFAKFMQANLLSEILINRIHKKCSVAPCKIREKGLLNESRGESSAPRFFFALFFFFKSRERENHFREKKDVEKNTQDRD